MHFDKNHDGRITYDEFEQGLAEMNFDGDVQATWDDLDRDKSGELTMDEIDQKSADLWASFRRWAGTKFTSREDMEARLGGNQASVVSSGVVTTANRRTFEKKGSVNALGSETGADAGGFTMQQFCENVVRLGWHGSFEAVLFRCLDPVNAGLVRTEHLVWFDQERKKQLRRSAAKSRGIGGSQAKMRHKLVSMRSLQSFLAFLRMKYGCLFKAWRKALDLDGSMTVHRKELFKACRDLNWDGNITALWKALDADDSGTTTLDELVPALARTLAVFKRWTDTNFGDAKQAIKRLDAVDGRRQALARCCLSLDEWKQACEKLRCPCDAEKVFKLLDWEDDGTITYQELKCLDKWKPQPWLLAEPNEQAAEAFRKVLRHQYKHMVKAWRLAVDRDGSNRVSWNEFQEVARRVKFQGDIPGAWVALDSDTSGYISLREWDAESSEILAEFRKWAHCEFGSVLCAMEMMDKDGSGSLTFKELRKGLRTNGYRGDCFDLFKSLDIDGGGEITGEELSFLDEWELAELLDDNSTDNLLDQMIATDSGSPGAEADVPSRGISKEGTTPTTGVASEMEMRREAALAVRHAHRRSKDRPPSNDRSRAITGQHMLQLIGWAGHGGGNTSTRKILPWNSSLVMPSLQSRNAFMACVPSGAPAVTERSRTFSRSMQQKPKGGESARSKPRMYLGGRPYMASASSASPCPGDRISRRSPSPKRLTSPNSHALTDRATEYLLVSSPIFASPSVAQSQTSPLPTPGRSRGSRHTALYGTASPSPVPLRAGQESRSSGLAPIHGGHDGGRYSWIGGTEKGGSAETGFDFEPCPFPVGLL